MKTNVWCNTCETAFSANHGEDGKCPRCRREYSLVGVSGSSGVSAKDMIRVQALVVKAMSVQATIEGMKASGGYSEECFLEYGRELGWIAENIEKIAKGEEHNERGNQENRCK